MDEEEYDDKLWEVEKKDYVLVHAKIQKYTEGTMWITFLDGPFEGDTVEVDSHLGMR